MDGDEAEAEVDPAASDNPDKRGLAVVVGSNPTSDSKLPVPLLPVKIPDVAPVGLVIAIGSSSVL